MTPVVDAVLRRPKREYPSHCLDYLGSYRIFVDKIMLYLIKQWISKLHTAGPHVTLLPSRGTL